MDRNNPSIGVAKEKPSWSARSCTAWCPNCHNGLVLHEISHSSIHVHGRTREQGFSGRISLADTRAVADAVKTIPVTGNGDITTPEAARVMLAETGCDGVSIGRGAFYNPWIFRQTNHYLQTGEPSGSR